MTRSDCYRSLNSDYFRAVREGKRTKAATIAADAIATLPTMEEVMMFATAVRIQRGVQDISMLPEGTYRLDTKDSFGSWDNRPDRPRSEIGRDDFVKHLVDDGATDVKIDWPSVTFHWGVAVFFKIDGMDCRAFSADYAPTETYLSS
jgi:hypothetical protein